MNENEFFDILAGSIVSVKNTDSIISGNFNIVMNKSKYSSTYSRNLFLDGIRIPVNKKTKIEYRCGQCNISKITYGTEENWNLENGKLNLMLLKNIRLLMDLSILLQNAKMKKKLLLFLRYSLD